jgi:hypothetical protein
MICKHRRAAAALALLAGISVMTIAAEAQSEILAARTRTDAIVFGGATYLIDWNGAAAGGTSVGFSTPAASTKVIVLFNAECAVDGEEWRYVDVDLVVDPAGPTGETVVPSNRDNALCSGNGTSTATPSDFTLDGWVSAAIVGVVTLPQAGSHTLRVRVNGGAAGVSRLDDMSLAVIR